MDGMTMMLTIIIDHPTGDVDENLWEIRDRRQVKTPLGLDQARALRDLLDHTLDPRDTIRLHDRQTIMWQTRLAHARTIDTWLDRSGVPDTWRPTIPDADTIITTLIINPHNWGTQRKATT